MSKLGEILKSNVVKVVVSALGGGGIIGVISSLILGVSSGTPIMNVTKSIAVDNAKSYALSTLYGSDDIDDSYTLADYFTENKWQNVFPKSEGLFKQFSSKYICDVYKIDSNIFVGNRRFNKPSGVNFAWSSNNATDFELATFSLGTVKNNTYIAYDSDTALLILGELKGRKLNGWVVYFDEYYTDFTLKYFKRGENKSGIEIKVDKNGLVEYFLNGKVKATYDFNEDEFSSRIKGNLINIDYIDNSYYIFEFDNDVQVIYKINDNSISYISKSCSFNGNAFKFDCKYGCMSYNYKTLIGLDFKQDNNVTVGGLYTSDSTDAEVIKLSTVLTDLGLNFLTGVCVDAVETAIPPLKILDTGTELLTGESFEDKLKNTIENIEENGLQDKLNDLNIFEESTDEEPQPSYDEIKEALNYRGIDVTIGN